MKGLNRIVGPSPLEMTSEELSRFVYSEIERYTENLSMFHSQPQRQSRSRRAPPKSKTEAEIKLEAALKAAGMTMNQFLKRRTLSEGWEET